MAPSETTLRKRLMNIQSLKVGEIEISPNRKRRHGDISQLIESIQAIGLMNPITVVIHEKSGGDREVRPVPVLVAGRNRLEAFREIGEEEIPAVVLDLYDLDMELAEIDENLVRNELTKLERADHLKRRREIFEAKGGKTFSTLGGPQLIGFAADTTEKVGESKQGLNAQIRRARDIAPDVKEEIADTPIADSGVELDALAKADPKDQRIAVARVKEGKAETVRDALPKKRDETLERLKAAQRAYMRLTAKERQLFREWMPND